jgi:hypothetical protein
MGRGEISGNEGSTAPKPLKVNRGPRFATKGR